MIEIVSMQGGGGQALPSLGPAAGAQSRSRQLAVEGDGYEEKRFSNGALGRGPESGRRGGLYTAGLSRGPQHMTHGAGTQAH